ncbi:MAG: hypothetical protein K6F77_01795 [Lachnospiraceae bacterium]|nr:hypothetical protein [Lachnospiraceae bacterium]
MTKEELLSISKIGTEVDIDTEFTKEYMSISIPITYRVDNMLFSGFFGATNSGRQNINMTQRTYGMDDCTEFLSQQKAEIQGIYEEWIVSVLINQKESEKVYDSEEAAKAPIEKALLDRKSMASRIERIIGKTKSEFDLYLTKHANAKIQQKFLLFISDCCQIIRDMTLSFVVAGQNKMLPYNLNEEVTKARQLLIANYQTDPVFKAIAKRGEVSFQIISETNEIISQLLKLEGLKNTDGNAVVSDASLVEDIEQSYFNIMSEIYDVVNATRMKHINYTEKKLKEKVTRYANAVTTAEEKQASAGRFKMKGLIPGLDYIREKNHDVQQESDRFEIKKQTAITTNNISLTSLQKFNHNKEEVETVESEEYKQFHEVILTKQQALKKKIEAYKEINRSMTEIASGNLSDADVAATIERIVSL